MYTTSSYRMTKIKRFITAFFVAFMAPHRIIQSPSHAFQSYFYIRIYTKYHYTVQNYSITTHTKKTLKQPFHNRAAPMQDAYPASTHRHKPDHMHIYTLCYRALLPADVINRHVILCII